MKRRVIPQIMLEVSPLCLGTTTFGAPVDKVEATRIVHWALDHGINFVDTADTYEGYGRQPSSAGGVAESVLGDALEEGRQPSLNGTDNLKTMALVDACHRAAKEDKQLDDHSFGSDDGEGGTVRLSLWNHPGEGIYGVLKNKTMFQFQPQNT